MVAMIGIVKLHLYTPYDVLNKPYHVPYIPNEIEVDYSPIGFVPCGRSLRRIPKIFGENRQGDGRQGNGGAKFAEVQRNGRERLPATAAARLRQV